MCQVAALKRLCSPTKLEIEQYDLFKNWGFTGYDIGQHHRRYTNENGISIIHVPGTHIYVIRDRSWKVLFDGEFTSSKEVYSTLRALDLI